MDISQSAFDLLNPFIHVLSVLSLITTSQGCWRVNRHSPLPHYQQGDYDVCTTVLRSWCLDKDSPEWRWPLTPVVHILLHSRRIVSLRVRRHLCRRRRSIRVATSILASTYRRVDILGILTIFAVLAWLFHRGLAYDVIESDLVTSRMYNHFGHQVTGKRQKKKIKQNKIKRIETSGDPSLCKLRIRSGATDETGANRPLPACA